MRIVSRARNLRRFAIAVPAALIALALVWFGISEVIAGRTAAQHGTSELSERTAIKAEVRRLFQGNDLAAVERLALSYRDGTQRTQSGIWKLTLFYGAFQDLSSAIGRDDLAGWNDLSSRFDAWQRAYRNSPSALIANAVALKARAWTLRPRTFVLEASIGSENRSMRTLRLAAEMLDRSKALAATDPHFYAVRSDLAAVLSEDPGAFMERIDEGLAKAPGYFPVYFAGLNYFADGNAAQRPDVARRIEAFANTAAKRLPGSQGAAIYARLYWYAYTAVYGDDLFARSRVDWNRMRDGIDAVMAQHPDDWNRNNFAYLACLERDRATTQKLIAGLSEPILSVWKAKPIFAGCQSWANGQDVAVPGKTVR